ncbi:MAG: alanine racemase [Peptococcaceae bacterium]|jgi:alanine racemase|nr:alanine racemase [Peptococcaceae bacterium]
MNNNDSAIEIKNKRPSFAVIDLGAIGRNVRKWKQMLSSARKCRLMAVVKANGYGHGAVPVAKRVVEEGADWLGVALAQEAMELREAGISVPIQVLGYAEPSAYGALIEADVRITIYSLDQGEALAQAARAVGKTAKVHIKVDTGMGRIGFLPGETAEAEILALKAMEGLELEGCFTHLARADEDGEESEESWRGQISLFRDFLARMRESGVDFAITHCANTAAGMREAAAFLDMWRVGIGVYGLYPSPAAKDWGLIDLEPALSWKSILSHVKWIQPGCGVGYGHSWKAEKETLIGTIPIGYADGYSRSLANKSQVLVGGHKAPVIGSVCMDQIILDLTGAPDAKPGDEVVLIGRQGDEVVGAEDLSGLLGTSCYEIVCVVGSRVPRHYIG